MYEDQTYEAILDRLLENTRDDIDKTEGSVLYTAIAPAGLEFAIHYTELDGLIREGYADTCDRDNLILRCKERGITPYPATAAVLKGEFNVDIGVGQRFSLDELNYISESYSSVSNPYVLSLVAVSVWNTLNDPTTKGLGDSERAKSYTDPQ